MTRHLFVALAFASGSCFAADSVKDFNKTVSINPKGRVYVDTYKGLVRVTTWDQPKVEVQVRIEPDGWGINDRDLVQSTDIEFDAGTDSVRMKTRYPKQNYGGWFGNNWSLPVVRYTIRMPRTAELRIKDYKSEIDVDGLSAALNIDTYKGDVRVRRQDGGVNVKTYKSEASISFARFSDHSSFETYRGEYDISLPRDSRFELSSDVGRRASVDTSFQLLMPAGSSRDRKTFRATVNGGGPAMSLRGYRGTFRIR